MIQVVNRKIYKGLSFEDYLKLPGISHSDIKNNFQKIVPTQPMKLGTDIHQYLLTPEEYHHENRKIVKPAAAALLAKLGGLWRFIECELSITCTFQVQDENGDWWELEYRGRGDMVVHQRLVIDAKVTKMPLSIGCSKFGYHDQQNGYRLAFGCKAAIMLGVHPDKATIETYVVPNEDEFWRKAILKYGKPVK